MEKSNAAKAVFVFAVALLPIAGTLVYFSMWRDYYFPDRYEEAYLAYVVAAVMSAVALVSASAFYLVAHFRRR